MQTDAIAILALIISFGALMWNIVRDLILDRINIDIEATAGKVFGVQGIPSRGVFVDATAHDDVKPGSLLQNPQVAFFITNTGRRPLMIVKICGEYQPGLEKPFWILTARELPKMIQPYERLAEIADSPEFVQQVKENKILKIWVEDSKRKRWYLSDEKLKRLIKTADSL